MNASSSRSHAVVTLLIEKRTKSSVGSRKYLCQLSKLNLVDLAGSESVEKSGTEGTSLTETASINGGLLVLHRVINALVKNEMHIPYRDHPLTKILQSSLGGNSKTLFIAHISPIEYNISESLSTLRYATQAKSVQNMSVKDVVEKEEESSPTDDDFVDPTGIII